MRKIKSEGLRNRLKEVLIKNRMRLKELNDMENKTPIEREEFHNLKQLKELKKQEEE